MASGSEIIEIEIVLEDGQVKKGFVDLAKSGEKFKASIQDNLGKGVSESAAKAEGALGGIGESFGKVAAVAGPAAAALAAVVGTVAAGFKIMNEISEQSKIAEDIRAVNAQFDVLAGSMSGNLKASFAETARGLIDMDDILQSSNRTLAAFSISADVLASNLKTARLASVAFGVDTTTAYEALNQAIITGNTRQLRQLGIFIDSERAVKDYAKTIGVAAEFVNEAGKQQAIANAIHAQSEKVFKGVNAETEKNSEGAQRLRVSWQEMKEATAAFIDLTAGAQAASSANWLARVVDSLKELIHPTGPQTGAESIQRIQQKIQDLNGDLKQEQDFLEQVSHTMEANGSSAESAKNQIARLQSQLSGLRDEEEKLIMIQMKKQQAADQNKMTHEQEVAQIREKMVNNEALAKQQEALAMQRASMQLANAQNEMATAQTVDAFEQGRQDALLAQQELYFSQQLALKKQYLDAGYTEEEFNKTGLLALEEQYSNARKKIMEQENATTLKLRGIVQSGIVNGLTSAFSGLGKALVTGQNGFNAFAGAVISALGSIAIQIGTLLVSIGLGFEPLGLIMPVWAKAGAATVAKGLGLIVLGGALQAMGGSVGAGPAGATGGGVTGGDSGGAPNSASAVEQTDFARKDQGAKINVNIAGNVLDRRQTGLELVDIIKEQFDTQGGQTIVGLA